MSARAAGKIALIAMVALTVAAAVSAQQPALPGTPSAPAASTLPSPVAGAPAKDAKADDKAAPTRGEDRDVIIASQKWLKLIDAGQYGDAWDGGAAPLKSSVTRQSFVEGMARLRKGYGKVASRKTGNFARTHTIPGAPDGDYALVSFQTRFANGKAVDEQVIWMLESEDSWRVSGYFMR